MNLNDISLSPQLMADWYPHALVEGSAGAVPQLPPVTSTGRAGKNILIITNNEKQAGLPDEDLAFLTKVLSACQLGLADVAIVNWSSAPHQNAAAMIKQFSAKSVILFGMAAEAFGLPANSPLYTVNSVQGQQYVIAPSLNEIEKTKEAKTKLWASLKQLFCI